MFGIQQYAIGALIILLSITGWYAKHEHDKLITVVAYQKQAVADRKAEVKKQDEYNAEQTKNIAAAWKHDHDTLIERLRKLSTDSNEMSQASDSNKTDDGKKQELSRACEDTEFYSNALEDALMLQTWQDWARYHGLIVLPAQQ